VDPVSETSDGQQQQFETSVHKPSMKFIHPNIDLIRLGVIFSATSCISMASLCYEHDVRPSVRPSVCSVDFARKLNLQSWITKASWWIVIT